jgi:hypothetical protein
MLTCLIIRQFEREIVTEGRRELGMGVGGKGKGVGKRGGEMG